MIVGYKLVNIISNEEVQSWGGIWGQCPNPPNLLFLPNGIHIHSPVLDINYNGYKLVEWEMEEPAPSVPTSVTPRQVRLLLLQQNLLANVETMIAQQDESTKITWQYALEFRRNDPLLNQLATNLNLTQEQIDQFFITASQL